MSDSTFEAATVQDALEQAASQLGAEQDQLEYEVVEEKQDFWGTGGGTVVVKAWKSAPVPVEVEVEETTEEAVTVESPEIEEVDEPAPERAGAADEAPESTEPDSGEPAAAAGGNFWDKTDDDEAGDVDGNVATTEDEETPRQEPAAEPEAVAAAVPGEVDETPEATERPDNGDSAEQPAGEVDASDIVALLEQIFHDMEFECVAEVQAQPDGFLAAVSGADKDLLLEGSGRCLSALELILNNAFRHKLERGHKVRVDAGDFRSRRDEELADLAYQIAHSAKDAGRTQETQPLNPYERRLVHLALAEDPEVTTRSRGSGFLKNVQVIPNREGGRGNRD